MSRLQVGDVIHHLLMLRGESVHALPHRGEITRHLLMLRGESVHTLPHRREIERHRLKLRRIGRRGAIGLPGQGGSDTDAGRDQDDQGAAWLAEGRQFAREPTFAPEPTFAREPTFAPQPTCAREPVIFLVEVAWARLVVSPPVEKGVFLVMVERERLVVSQPV